MRDRRDMPQIASADRADFVLWLRGRGVGVRHWAFPGDALSYRQAVSAAHAAQMPAEALAKPVLVSSDRVVLDGNHRAAANAALGRNVNVVQIGLPFEDAVEVMFEYPRVSVKEAVREAA